MGPVTWWEEKVLPRLNHRALAGADAAAWRAPVCAGASGTVLDIGFGSGPNLPLYPEAVRRVLAAEPSDLAWSLAADRTAAFGRPVERVSLDAADLAGVPDASVDTAVSAWSMCTVPDIGAALAEARRVLTPSGSLRFVEHARSPDPKVARTQDRIQPVWGRLAGGCHVDRDLVGLVEGAGFTVEVTRRQVVAGGLARPWSWSVSGVARPR